MSTAHPFPPPRQSAFRRAHSSTPSLRMEPASGRELATAPYEFTRTREQEVTREEARERVPTIVEQLHVVTKTGNHDATMLARESKSLTVEPWVEPAAATPPRVDHPHSLHPLPRPPWLLVLSAIVCVGLIVWWFTAQRAPSVDPQGVIDAQLLAAQKAASEGHYADPYERSALHYYSTVLTIDEKNPQALAGLKRLADQLVATARVHLDAGSYADAVVALNGARRIDPAHRGLASLEGDLRRELQSLAARAPSSSAAKEAASLASTMTAADKTAASPAKKTESEKVAVAPARVPEAASGGSAAASKLAEPSKQAPPAVSTASAPLEKTSIASTSTASTSTASVPVNQAAVLAAAAAVATDISPAGADATLTGSATPSGSATPGTSSASMETVVSTAAANQAATKAAEAVLPPIVKYVPPEYPDEARMRGIEGWADLSFLVASNGDVIDPRVENSSRRQIFGRPALAAVKKWRYEPPAPGHAALTERTKVRIEFQLER
jgi:TonB family protein